jgi:hypothetical protein
MVVTSSDAVRLATDSRIHYLCGQPGVSNLPYVPTAAAYNLNPLIVELVHGTVAHASGQHHPYSHFKELRDNIRLATTAFRRSESLLGNDLSVVINSKDSKALAVAKMAIDLLAVRRNCDLHGRYFPSRNKTWSATDYTENVSAEEAELQSGEYPGNRQVQAPR